MIKRCPQEACGPTYDLLVVGGGVYGVALTLEAARRGLRPLLIERGDFGHATSWNTLRLVHGGLRYLQTLDWRRLRGSSAERSWFLRHFPDLVEPLPCLMPLYGDGLRRPGVFRLALLCHDLLSRRRNEGLREDRRLPDGRMLGVRETVERFPAVDRQGLRGAGLWYEGHMPDSQRLLIEMLRWATSCGARMLNYVEAEGLLAAKNRVLGIRARDLVNGDDLEYRAPVVVNCTGPWCREVARRFDRDIPRLFHPSLAFNVLLDRAPLVDAALAVTPRRPLGATYFLVPWQGRMLAGTRHAGVAENELPERVDERLIRTLLADLNRAVPGVELRYEEVLRIHWGFLPATRPGSHRLTVRPVICDHGTWGGPQGLFSVSGVKFTTARRLAEKALSLILAQRGERLPTLTTVRRPEPVPCLEAKDFEDLSRRDPAAAAAHVRRLTEKEAVVYLEDLILRRTSWGMDPGSGQRLEALASRLLGSGPGGSEREMLANHKAAV